MVNRFILQWHLSEHCNLHCLHCYQDGHKPVCLKFDELKNIYEQYKKLLKKMKMKGHINLTGGEPICNPFFFKVLDLIKQDSDLISFSILSNGTLIDAKMAKKIASYNPYYVQVSLEGGKKTNDHIRGKGTYKQIGKGVDNLKKEGIFTSISFTATNINYMEFPKVVKFAKKHNVNNVWSDRYIPLGKEDKSLMLTYNQTRSYLNIMNKEREKLLKKNITIPTVSMYRALQFQMTNDFAYGCTAGDTLLTVMENGDLVPCRRMPIVVGNLLKDDMYDLYINHPLLKELRKNKIPDDCKLCDNAELCHGGLKCLTYALYNDLNHKDVGCNFDV
ncbi:MAG: radical SAM protein [Bacilli bacterium]|nr:radical SAM protein [Bacilli bacterium]